MSGIAIRGDSFYFLYQLISWALFRGQPLLELRPNGGTTMCSGIQADLIKYSMLDRYLIFSIALNCVP